MDASRIVVTGWVPPPALEHLQTSLGADLALDAPQHESAPDRAGLLRRVAGAHALVTLVTDNVDAELLDAAGPQLRVVANVAAGHNNIDVDACRERGVVVTNTPGVLAEATADIALALLLMVTRRLAEGERLIRSGTPWQWSMSMLLGSGVQGGQLGIVGLGEIGQAMAHRGRALGMRVAYTQRSRADAQVEAGLETERVELDELLAGSDVVSLHCPYGPATHHLIGAAQLEAMKPTAFLVNTARGPIVDEAALVEALEAGQIAGAGLDVFEHEPAVHPGLGGRDDVVLLPHLGSATLQTRTAMARLAVDNVVAVLSGQPAFTPVD